MFEISLHILDVMQNSIRADATQISVTVSEDPAADRLTVTVADNGCGMDEKTAASAADSFYTTRKTRRVGLGLSLLKAAAEGTGGSFALTSQKGRGTIVTACFGYHHIDRQPLGDMGQTIAAALMGNPQLQIIYHHSIGGQAFCLQTRILEKALHANFAEPCGAARLADFITEQIQEISKGR